ncbi:MAG: DUF58 domain-containing protein [Deltaproteobacteria bacterium]|nr:DUF58 domain-containing protein [Deltaproteobacteria bacterium]
MRLRGIDLGRLNHVLIPQDNATRDRWRRSLLGRLLRPVADLVLSLTEEGQVLLLMTLLAGLAGLDIPGSLAYLAWALWTGALGTSVLVSRWWRLREARVEVRCPPRVTLGEAITFSVEVLNTGAEDLENLRVEGPFLPWDGRWETRLPRIARVRPGERASITLRGRFRARGEHNLDPFRVASLVPLGLCRGPAVETAPARFVVVPPLAHVQRLSLPTGQRHQPGGVAMAARTGESMDLLGIRPYRPGDPVRDLHARSWARVGAPVVREYQQEYFSRVGVVLDTDLRGADHTLLEGALSLVAGIVARLSRGEALIDLLVLGDAVHDLTVGRAMGFLDQALDLLACVKPIDAPRPEALSARLAPFLPRLSQVVFVALAWDAPRVALARSLADSGAGLKTYVLVHREGRITDPDAREVPLRAVTAREPLVL